MDSPTEKPSKREMALISLLNQFRQENAELKSLLEEFLTHNKTALHPGKGVKDAQFVRRVCDSVGLDENKYLESFVVKNKQNWGL